MEEKSRLQKALDNIVPSRRREAKAQSNYNQLFGNDASIYGYNTSSGFYESDKLKEIERFVLLNNIIPINDIDMVKKVAKQLSVKK